MAYPFALVKPIRLLNLVIFISYRKAPEYVFPVAMEDCRNSTIEFMKKAKDYNVDPSKVGLMGISAGELSYGS